jgi:peptidoglycan/xylan/chitin deacetylase (PgdA/CDA1 family)
LILLRAVILIPLLLALASTAHTAPPRIVILCYHEVEKDGLPPHHVIPRHEAVAATPDEMARYTISTEAFRQQMDLIDLHGYEVVPLDHVVDYVTGLRTTLPARAAVITVDDGWRSTGTEIAQEMARRRWPFTAFVYPRVIERHSSHPYNLTWAGVSALAKKGFSVESHSYTHALLSRTHHPQMSENNYAAFLNDELRCSRDVIATRTGHPVRFLAYPYGDHDPHVVAAAKAAGYEAAVTVKRGAVTKRSDPFALERYLVLHDTTLQDLESWLQGR